MALKSGLLMCADTCQGLLQAREQSGEDVFQGGESVIGNPLYCTCLASERSNTEHDQLNMQNMSPFVESFGSNCKTKEFKEPQKNLQLSYTNTR